VELFKDTGNPKHPSLGLAYVREAAERRETATGVANLAKAQVFHTEATLLIILFDENKSDSDESDDHGLGQTLGE
jgi:hypothetical protein